MRGSVSIDFQAVQSRFPAGKPLDVQILLELIGKERSKICQAGQTIARKAERVLLYNQTLLHHVTPADQNVWNSNAGSGGCVDFGFSLVIPAFMPGSFRCDAPGRSYAEIVYKLVAVMELTDPSLRKITSRTITSKEQIIPIRAAPIPPIVVPWMMQPTNHPIKNFGLGSKGFIIFGVLVTDTHVGPGETLKISFACRNHSTVDVEKLYIKLVETVSWVLDTTTTSKKQMKSVERVLHQQEEIMRVPQQPSRDLWYQTSFGGGVTTAQDNCIALYDDLVAQKQVLRVTVPADDSTNDDYAGPLVKCTHHLEIRIKTENHVDDPRVLVPLQFKQFQTCSGASQGQHTVLRKQSMMVAPQRDRRCCDDDDDDSDKTCLDTSSSTAASQEITAIPEQHQGHADIYVPSYYGAEEHTTTSGNNLSAEQENITSTYMTQEEIPLSQIRAGGWVRDVPTSAPDRESNLSQTSSCSYAANPELSTTEEEPPAVVLLLPSFENLLQEMLFSVDDFDIVCSKLEDPEWRPIFFRMSPDEFGSMLAHVNMDHDQPKVAAIVAGQISMESDFLLQHVIHALRNAADWTRASIVQRLLPFCSDLLESKELLKQELTPWELTVLAGDLEKAICNRLSHRSGGGHITIVRSKGGG